MFARRKALPSGVVFVVTASLPLCPSCSAHCYANQCLMSVCGCADFSHRLQWRVFPGRQGPRIPHQQVQCLLLIDGPHARMLCR